MARFLRLFTGPVCTASLRRGGGLQHFPSLVRGKLFPQAIHDVDSHRTQEEHWLRFTSEGQRCHELELGAACGHHHLHPDDILEAVPKGPSGGSSMPLRVQIWGSDQYNTESGSTVYRTEPITRTSSCFWSLSFPISKMGIITARIVVSIT